MYDKLNRKFKLKVITLNLKKYKIKKLNRLTRSYPYLKYIFKREFTESVGRF